MDRLWLMEQWCIKGRVTVRIEGGDGLFEAGRLHQEMLSQAVPPVTPDGDALPSDRWPSSFGL